MKATITDPANTADDLFGFSIAAAGKRMVVGAPGTSGSKGAVYYFNEVRGGWLKKSTLTAWNAEGCSATCSEPVGLIYGDYLGNSVALLEGTTVAVGAPYPTPKPDSVGSGAACVFTGSGSSWSQTSEISDPTEDAANSASLAGCNGFSNPCNALDQFGNQVALVGTTVVAAAPYDSEGHPNNATGSAFLFQKGGSTWPTPSPSSCCPVMASPGTSSERPVSSPSASTRLQSPLHMRPGRVQRLLLRELIVAW